MIIRTRVKSNWIELTVEDGSVTISYDIWKSELVKIKEMLEFAIDDINYMIDKTQGVDK